MSHLLPDRLPGGEAIDTLERFADGQASRNAVAATTRFRVPRGSQTAKGVLELAARLRCPELSFPPGNVADAVADAVAEHTGQVAVHEEEQAAQAELLRDVFGPAPFHEVVLDPNWLTSTVVQLARGIYDERAFDRLPILADLLMDAGCADEAVPRPPA